jgi:CheY-like chemotaxis protein
MNLWAAGKTILLVDDEETVRVVGGRMLKHIGFEVVIACDGREALALYGQHAERIGCVLLDLTMPHMDGEEAFRQLRRIREDLPILLSSGYNEQEVLSRFAGRGYAGFIQKPYQLDELEQKLRDVFEKPGSQQE